MLGRISSRIARNAGVQFWRRGTLLRMFGSYPDHTLVAMPSLSPTMETGKIEKWLVQEGDEIQPGDVLCDVVTDKATVAFEYQDEGFLAKILKAEGTEGIQVGEYVAVMTEDKDNVSKFKDFVLQEGAAPAAAAPSQAEAPTETPAAQPAQPAASESASQAPAHAAPKTGERQFVSPLARKTAEEKGVNIAQVSGTGPGGRVIQADVLQFKPVAQPAQPAAAPVAASALGLPEFTDTKLTNVRKVIAERLTASKQQIPHYYVSVDCNMDNLLKLRARLNKIASQKLSVNVLLIKAAALAAKAVPETNSSWMGDFIRQYSQVDMSVAVQTDNGLITPIVKRADSKGLEQIASEMGELIQKAKENKLQPSQFIGGTFTLSNLGMFGVDHFTAIINPPQACILAVSSTVPKVVVDKEKLAKNQENPYKVANMMTVTLSSDHRVVDGAIAAQWAQKFRSLIETPEAMLL